MGGTTYICCMKHDSNISLRISSELRRSLDELAAEASAGYGIEVSSADLLRIGAKRLLAHPGELFKPPPVEPHA
jgi:hypothetical protein